MKPLKKVIKSGNHLFHENDRSRELYIIQSGNVKVYRKAGWREIELAVLGKGAVLGEMALIDGKPRSASAKAVDDCSVIIIDADTFHKRIRGVPSWFMSIIRMTSQKIRLANQRLQTIRCEHQGASIVITIFHLYNRFRDSPEFSLYVLQRRIIQVLGVAQQKVVQVFDFLNNNNFITLEDDKFIIPDENRYTEYCNFLRLHIRKTYEKTIPFSNEINILLITTVDAHNEIMTSSDPATFITGSNMWVCITRAGLTETYSDVILELKNRNLFTYTKSGDSDDKKQEPLSSYQFKINNFQWKRLCLYAKYIQYASALLN
jgi:CRP-like cAMP-binding protein